MPDSFGSFDAVQMGQSNIQKNYVGMQFCRFVNSFLAISCLEYDFPLWDCLQHRPNFGTPVREIIDHKNTRWNRFAFRHTPHFLWQMFDSFCVVTSFLMGYLWVEVAVMLVTAVCRS